MAELTPVIGLTCSPNNFSLCPLIAPTCLSEIQALFPGVYGRSWARPLYLMLPVIQAPGQHSSSCSAHTGPSAWNTSPYSASYSYWTPGLKCYALGETLTDFPFEIIAPAPLSHSTFRFAVKEGYLFQHTIIQFLMWLFVDCAHLSHSSIFSFLYLVFLGQRLGTLKVFGGAILSCSMYYSDYALMIMLSK